MRFMYCGDVVGKPGRKVIEDHIPRLRHTLALDAVVVCGENAAHGFGLTPKICEEFFAVGVDCITTGNHAFDQKEIVPFMDEEPRLIRPLNLPVDTPGRGTTTLTLANGQRLTVIQVLGRQFMKHCDDPWAVLEECLFNHVLGQTTDAIILDLHAEATSEKAGLAHFADGKVSLAIGTHTHVPTADGRIFSGGTAFQSDAGMCGPYDSVIGMRTDIATDRMRLVVQHERLQPASGPGTLCGVVVETDDATGLALSIDPVRVGGELPENLPVIEKA